MLQILIDSVFPIVVAPHMNVQVGKRKNNTNNMKVLSSKLLLLKTFMLSKCLYDLQLHMVLHMG